MISRELTIVNKLGLHARAAAKFVSTASRYGCEIHIERGGQRINGKSIMGVMMLAASKGSTLTLTAEGEDEEAAMAAIEDLVAGRFGESE
jgi:phosphocarrier protein